MADDCTAPGQSISSCSKFHFLICRRCVPLRAPSGCPGSKSISNRVLLLAGLAEGTTTVHDLLDSDDTAVMLEALRALGCLLVKIDASTLNVTGIGGRLVNDRGPALSRQCRHGHAAADGRAGAADRHPRRHLRAQRRAAHARAPHRRSGRCLARLGLRDRLPGHPRLSATEADRPVNADAGSAGQGARRCVQPVPDRTAAGAAAGGRTGHRDRGRRRADLQALCPHHAGTAGAIRHQRARDDGWQRFTIPAGSRYRSPGAMLVEGDASSASYFVALGAIAAVNSPLRIEGVGSASLQGDVRFVEAAQAMGAEVEAGPNWLQRPTWCLAAARHRRSTATTSPTRR